MSYPAACAGASAARRTARFTAAGFLTLALVTASAAAGCRGSCAESPASSAVAPPSKTPPGPGPEGVPDPPGVEAFPLVLERPHVAGDTTFALRSVAPAPEGGAAGERVWSFQIERADWTLEFEHQADLLYVEEASLGRFFVIDGRGEAIRVELWPDGGPEAMPEREAVKLAQRLASAQGMPQPDGTAWFAQNGLLTLETKRAGELVARARLGLHTRRLVGLERLSGWR